MELAKIESLLDSYFKGETSLDQENMLREYFSTADIAPHLMAYQGLFIGLKNAQKEVSEQEVSLPESSTNSRRWWLSIAVSLVILLGVIGLQFPTNQLTAEEQHALAEFNKSRTTLLLMSNSFNSATQELAVISQFTETKNRILK